MRRKMWKKARVAFVSAVMVVSMAAGCGQAGGAVTKSSAEDKETAVSIPAQESADAATDVGVDGEESLPCPQAAYEAFLVGDISLFDREQIDTWPLDIWKDTILFYGELEYTYLDLDGDGTEELLVQRIEEPFGFNAVFHYEDGRLFCWQFDCVEMTSGDYPLRDGTMVSQYNYNGASSYTIYRYQPDGEREKLSSLFVREELVDPNNGDPCPYYEVDGNQVDKKTFEEQLQGVILDQMLERSAWTEI